MKNAHCPTCKEKVVRKDNPAFPFCSRQCKMKDLGAWLDGKYAIPSEQENPSTEAPSGSETGDC